MIIYKDTDLGKVELHNEWKDITLHSAINISQMELPSVEDNFDWFKHINFVDNVMVELSNMTYNQWQNVHPTQRVYLFTQHLMQMVKDLHEPAPTTFAPQMIDSFTHDGIEYLMPTQLIVDEHTVILQHGQQVKPFIEASNLMKRYAELKSEGIKVMPLFVASVVKEDGEKDWNEAKVVERSQRFNTLTMDVVWEVFFCISQLTLKSLNAILQSMIEKQARPATLADRVDLRLGRLRSRKAELSMELKRLIACRFGISLKY